MKRLARLAGLCALVIILAIILWPLGPRAPKSVSYQAMPEEEERALHLESGLRYERFGLLDKAQVEYELAVSPDSDQISTLAKEGLERVLARQHNEWFNLQARGRAFLLWIAENGFKLTIAVAVAWLLWRLIVFIPRRAGYRLLPFQDHTDAGLGASLTSIIHTCLQSAKLAHQTSERGTYAMSEKLDFPNFGLLEDELAVADELVATVDLFKVGGIDLPFGQLLAAVQRWRGNQKHTLTGHVYHFGTLLWLEAEMRNSNTGAVERIWESRETLASESDLSERIVLLAHDIAYQVLHDLCPTPCAGSWRSFKLFTEALKEMQRFQTEPADLSCMESAVEKLRRVVAMDPGYLLARYNLGIVYTNLGEYRPAIDAFKEVKEASDELKLETTYNLGVAYYHLCQDWAYRFAIQQFEEAIDQLAQKIGDKQFSLLLALTHCGLANVYAQQASRPEQDAEELIGKIRRHADQALALASEEPSVHAAVHGALGRAYFSQGAWDQAIEEFKCSVRFRPNYPEAYIGLADSYLKKVEQDEAFHWLRRAVSINPRHEYAHYKMGEIYRDRDKADLAIESYSHAPTIPDAHNGWGKVLAEEKKDFDGALAAFRRAIDLNKKLAEAHSNLAWYIIEAGHRNEDMLREAADHAQQAVQLNEGTEHEWHSHDVLGWVYFRSQEPDKAEREYMLSIETEGDKPRGQNRYHLAELYLSLCRKEKAREMLIRLFEEVKEKDMWRAKAEELMRELDQRAPCSEEPSRQPTAS